MNLEKQKWFVSPGNQKIDTETAKENLGKNGVVDSVLINKDIAGTNWEAIKKKNKKKEQESGRSWYVSAENFGVDWKVAKKNLEHININRTATASEDDAELDAQLKKDQENLAKINELRKTADNNVSDTKKGSEELDTDDIMVGVEDLQKGLSGEGNFAVPKKPAEKNTEEIDVDDVLSGIEDIQRGPAMEDFQKNSQEKKNPEMSEKPENQEEKQKARLEQIANLKKEIEDARKEYLEVDYKKNTALGRIRKFFGVGKNKDNKYNWNNEQDQEIAEYRAYYDDKLIDLKKLLEEDARERNVSDEEIAGIKTYFDKETHITLAEEHDKVKIEQQEGSFKGFIGEKMVALTKGYQKLSFAKKMGIAGLFLAGGLAVGGVGGAVAGVLTGAIFARRLFSGMTAGVGTALGLEAMGQKRDKKNIEKEKQEFLEKIKGLSEEKKYELLSGNLKKIIIDEENSINKIKNQDIRQLAAGAAVGTFIGSGMMADLVKWGYHGVADYFTGTHIGGKVVEVAKEMTPSGENLTIKDGSSIEKTLIEYYKANNIHFNDSGYAADQAYRDYMTDYIEHNKDELIRTGKLDEYYKMLKDGMVNVKPGTEMVVDPNTGHIISIDGKLSHLNAHHVGSVDHHAPDGSSDHPASETPKVEGKTNFADNNNVPADHDLTDKADTARGNMIKGLEGQREELLKKIAEDQKKLDSTYAFNEERQDHFLMKGVDNSFEQDKLINAINENKAALAEIDNRLHELNSINAGSVTDNMSEVPNNHPGTDNMPSGANNVQETPSGMGAENMSEHAVPAPEQHVSGHFDADHPLKLKSGTISFAYDDHGNILEKGQKIIFSETLYGSNGQELFAENFDRSSLSSGRLGAVEGKDRVFLVCLKIYNQLVAEGHTKEAAALSKSLHKQIDSIENIYKVGKIFDRTKFPPLPK